MKVTILGNTNNPITGKPKDPYSWFCKSFNDGFIHNGIKPSLIDYKSNGIAQIRRQLLNIKPSYVFTHLTFHRNKHVPEKMMEMFSELYKKYDIRFVHTCSDARIVDRYMNDISECFYVAFVGTRDMVKNCSKIWKIPVHYTPYSSLTYNKIVNPVKDLSFSEAVFTGSPTSHPDRKAFIDLLRKNNIDLKIFQTQKGNDLRHRTRELSASASCILGLCTGYDINGFIDVRPFQYMGTGACFIARKFKNVDDILPPELYLSFNKYNQDGAEKVKEYWNYARNNNTYKLREKAFKYIQQHHSSKIRIQQIMKLLGENIC